MTPTQEAIVKLRLYLDEKIPPGGSQDDTRFSDTELEVLLDDSETIDVYKRQGCKHIQAHYRR